MRILLLSPLPPPTGGIATWTNLYINSSKAKENVVDVINTSVTRSRINNFVKKNIKDEIYRAKNIYFQTRRYLKSYKYDVVHINTSCSRFGMIRDYLCAKIVKSTKAKLVVHCHCDTSYLIKGKISEFFFKKICRLSDKIFCLNTSSYEHIKSLTNQESTNIPNFFEIKTLKTLNTFTVKNEINSIIFVGHITKIKGCYDILSVARLMPNITFTMIGNVSDGVKRIQAPQNVIFMGEVSKEQVLEQMRKSDLLLFPTHTEGFPNVVLEAMACGLPIVATPIGAIPDMLEGKGGVYVKIGDIESMIIAINNIKSRDKRKQMSVWNQEKVKNTYTVDIIMKRIFEEYANL